MSGINTDPTRDAALFVGRDAEVREIGEFLISHQSVSLIGLPGMGKTALLRRLADPAAWHDAGLASDSILYVYMDCALLMNVTPVEVFGALAATMARALAMAKLPPEPALVSAVAQPSRLAFEAAVRRLNGRGLAVILALDAFEQLSANPHLGVSFFNALRSAAARFTLVFLTASTRPLIELTAGEAAQDLLSSPFFNVFAAVFLGPLTEDDARHLIRDLLRATPTGLDSGSEDALYALVGGSPLALRLACQHAAAQAPEDLAGIVRRTASDLDTHYAAVWRLLTPSEQALQRHLDAAAARARTDAATRAVLHGLVRKGLLMSDGATWNYRAQAWAHFVAALPPV